MTFSIVAYDNDTNEVGFAIASCCWNSGVVCNAIAGKGIIAHQAAGSTKFHSIFFELVDKEKSIADIMNHFREIDEHIESRQIGLVNYKTKEVCSFTGKNCSLWAGHKIGKNYTCQGNILVDSDVIENMAHAFENTDGNLAEKLYAALQAGDKAGGDARGKQSARLCVKRLIESEPPISMEVVDFIIKDHDEPIIEIGRQLAIHSDYQKIRQIYSNFSNAETNDEKRIIITKVHNFLKDKKEYRYLSSWKDLAYFYHSIDDRDGTIECFKTVLDISPSFANSLKSQMKSFGFDELIIQEVLIN